MGDPGGAGEHRAAGRPAAGGGRWVEVPPERLARWFAGFAERHGATSHTVDGGVLRLRAFDMAEAECHPPPGSRRADDLDTFLAAALVPHRIGLILARKASVAVGIADGPTLTTSKVDSSYVQSRTAAGGWSQQRFARRRDNQAKAAAGDAADLVNRLIVPTLAGLDAVVAGGDRKTVETILSDKRLATVAARLSERFLDVPEPRLAVLQLAVEAARAVRIKVVDP
jgi:hypothetical protein